ncbi:coil containing protein [Vibrio phage 1.224.A._10N.261.48.B1]|uniref:Coil containing protein n=1 Tax=Vibrio phage 1.224.A._10N.261.48.B1 TaxID=1881226 RepID=A0A2I7RRX7_9CAUD|nr:coil containing protein [Vibrio phage 1.224.A._10N.261.48.B1]AUR96402.1 coil containing protein [Vibrio phage 1.224.A._10N.261.48.B1]
MYRLLFNEYINIPTLALEQGDEIIFDILWRDDVDAYTKQYLFLSTTNSDNDHTAYITDSGVSTALISSPILTPDLFGLENGTRHQLKFTMAIGTAAGSIDRFFANSSGVNNFRGQIFSIQINAAAGNRLYEFQDGWENNPVIADSLGDGSTDGTLVKGLGAGWWPTTVADQLEVSNFQNIAVMESLDASIEVRNASLIAVVGEGVPNLLEVRNTQIIAVMEDFQEKQRKGNITDIYTEDIFRDPNLYDMAAYADRSMEKGEILWQHTLPITVTVFANAPFSTGVLASPAMAPIQIDVSVSGSVVGSFNWKLGDTDATIIWTNTLMIFKDDEVVFTVVEADSGASSITLNLIGAYV